MQEQQKLYIIRESIGSLGQQLFDSTRATQSVQAVINPIQRREIDEVRNTPRVLRRFKEVLERLEVRKGDLKPATLAAFYTTDAAMDSFGSTALTAKHQDDAELFVLFFDTDFGATMGIHPILEVSRSKSAKPIPDISTIISDSSEDRERFLGMGSSIDKQAEVYLMIQAEQNRWAKLFNKTTSKKPEGFLLIDERTKQLKRLPNELGPYNLPTHFVPQFVAAGADFSRILFRAIYPISERFIESRQ